MCKGVKLVEKKRDDNREKEKLRRRTKQSETKEYESRKKRTSRVSKTCDVATK